MKTPLEPSSGLRANGTVKETDYKINLQSLMSLRGKTTLVTGVTLQALHC